MRIELTVRRGPLEGQRFAVDLGRAFLGRSPGPGGIVLPGDMLVALKHGELFERGGRVVYRNLSPAGTLVNGKKVDSESVVARGSKLAFGDNHVLEVEYREAGPAKTGARPAAGNGAGKSMVSSGPLAKPMVRVVLGVYGLGVLALFVFFATRGGADLAADFEEARVAYSTTYAPEGVAEDELEARLGRADALITQLRIVERQRDWQQARKICRQLMAVDSDSDSPLYQFAARQLGELEGRR